MYAALQVKTQVQDFSDDGIPSVPELLLFGAGQGIVSIGRKQPPRAEGEEEEG